MLLRSALIIVAVTMVGRLLGFIRGIFISHEFGVGMETDAYFAAFVIPMALLMIIPGAIQSVFIPALKGVRLLHEEEDRHLFEKVFTFVLAGGFLVTLAGFILSEVFVSLLVPGFEGVKKELTVDILRWMTPSILFIGLIGVFSSVLHVHNQFFYPSMGTVVNSLIVILSIFLLVPFMGVEGLALGTTLGFVGYAAIMLPSLWKKKYQFRLRGGWLSDMEMRGMGERVIPIFIGSVISQMTILFERSLASGLGDAKVASLALAYSVMQLPMAVFVGAFTVPLFPLLSDYAKQKKWSEMKQLLEKVISYLVLVLLPVMAGFIMLSEDVIRILYERGAFGNNDTMLTAWALMFYSTAILGLAMRDTLTRAYYALENTRTPVLIGVLGILLYLGLSLAFIPVFDHGGIALAMGIAAYLSNLLLIFFLQRRLGAFLSRTFALTTFKSMIATGIMVLFVLGLNGFPGQLSGPISFNGLLSQWSLFIRLTLLVAGGGLIYILSLWILRESFTLQMLNRVKNRLKKRINFGS